MKFEEINTSEELFKYLDNISYGWRGIDNIIRIDSLKGFKEYYRTMNIEDILKYKVGTCPEQVNLCKYFFDKKNIENKILVICGYENVNGEYKERVHFMFLYKNDNMWCQIEHASRFFNGIFKYNTLENAKKEILSRYNDILKGLILFEIEKIPIGLSYNELREVIIKNVRDNV